MIKKIIITTLLIIIILFNKLSVEGAYNGLNLWFYSIIPSLFPAMIIGNILLSCVANRIRFPRLIIVFIGIVCGCPIAAMTADIIGTYNSNRIVPLANCLSLSFIINFVCLKLYSNEYTTIILLCIYLPLVTAITVYFIIFRNCLACNEAIISNSDKESLSNIIDKSIQSSLHGILNVGAYIILCSAFCNILKTYIAYDWLRIAMCSILEITNGCKIISESSLSIQNRIILTCIFCNFSGICCILQSKSILGAKISIKKYIYDKMLLSAATALFSTFIIYVL